MNSDTRKTVEGYIYDTASNRLQSAARMNYRWNGVAWDLIGTAESLWTYSDSGNTATQDKNGANTVQDYEFTYDSRDRPVSISNAGTLVFNAKYNAMGQRVRKGSTAFLYDLSGQLIAEHHVRRGPASAEYIWLDGMVLGYVTGGTLYWVHQDHIGRPVMVAAPTGAPQWETGYRPFGQLFGETGTVAINLRFPGQYDDPETVNLHYNYFRDYDASLGRYIQSDPIGLAGGWNTYAYVDANPVMRVDPEGLQEGAAACAFGPPGCAAGALYEAGKWTLAVCVGLGVGAAVSEGIDAMSDSNDDGKVVPFPIPAPKQCEPAQSNANGGNCEMCNLRQQIDLGTPTAAERGPFPESARKWRCIYDCGSIGLKEIPDTLINIMGCPSQLAASSLVTYPK